MIRYDLLCAQDDSFEGWFRDSVDFDEQCEKGLLACPICGSPEVRKAVMSPAVIRSGRKQRAAEMEAFAAKVREHIQQKYDYVGDRFADEVRAMSDGGAEERPVWGEATPEEARALIEEGAPIAPLPATFAPPPPRKVN